MVSATIAFLPECTNDCPVTNPPQLGCLTVGVIAQLSVFKDTASGRHRVLTVMFISNPQSATRAAPRTGSLAEWPESQHDRVHGNRKVGHWVHAAQAENRGPSPAGFGPAMNAPIPACNSGQHSPDFSRAGSRTATIPQVL